MKNCKSYDETSTMEDNKEIRRRALIQSVQFAYEEYKAAAIMQIRYSYYDDDCHFCVAAGLGDKTMEALNRFATLRDRYLNEYEENTST